MGGMSGTGGTAPPVVLSKGGVMLRLLTHAEYLASVNSLLGTLTTQLSVPEDLSVAGFASVGAGQMSVTDMAATAYETASLAATAEVFGNATRWQQLVGCMPKPDLSDACVATYIKKIGRAAFRRDLTEASRTTGRAAAQDFGLFAHDWGFRLEDITVPVVVWQADLDVNVPAVHAERQAAAIPGSVLHLVAGEGHLMVVDHLPEIFAELLAAQR